MLSTILEKLAAIKAVLANPELANTLDSVGDFCHTAANYLRMLQQPVFASSPGDAAALEECEALLAECRAMASPSCAVSMSAVNPATILLVIELVAKVLEEIRKRRNPT